ncbi:MAG: hypothetical protein NVV74_00215 [Magnetospirillum sp.]|nr:hypothetical protein [Magnetospirillum sp.]
MQEIAVAAIVALAAAVLAVKVGRAILRRCRPRKPAGCDKCCKCG